MEDTNSLVAYFDESGTHDQYGLSPATCIAGFIGTTETWELVAAKWDLAMNGSIFHYTDYKNEAELLDQLAVILASSELQVVSAGFLGDWKEVISYNTDWKIRFPSCYNALFEMCVDQMDRFSAQLWKNQTIKMIFAEQHQYEKRVEEIWRTMQGNELWQKIESFNYGTPKNYPQLQIADMLAHEIFQCMKVMNKDSEVWYKWPLVKKLLDRGIVGVAGYHTAESFIEMMKKNESNGKQYLKNISKNKRDP